LNYFTTVGTPNDTVLSEDGEGTSLDYSAILNNYCHIPIFIFNKTLLFDLFLLSDVQTVMKRRKTGKESNKAKKPNKFRDLRQSYLEIERKI